MEQLAVQFTPSDGTVPRTITLRIGEPVQQKNFCWSVLVEILGFQEPFTKNLTGTDWAQALEFAAMILPVILQGKVSEAGGGTLDPSFYKRDPTPPDLSKLPPEVAAILSS